MTMISKTTSSLTAALLLAAPLLLADGNARGDARLSLGGKNLSISYGRPSLNGRDMLGKAEVGQQWRMGSDAATTLKSEADLQFGAVALAKGEYVLRARKDAEDKWTLLANREGQTVAEVPLSYRKLDAPVETLVIELQDAKGAGRFEMRWGTAALSADFKAK
jgi:hypothetical protein